MESCDASSGFLILAQAVILKVHGDPFNLNARTDLIRRAERASVNMEEVKECRFIELDINREGVLSLQKNESSENAIENQNPTDPNEEDKRPSSGNNSLLDELMNEPEPLEEDEAVVIDKKQKDRDLVKYEFTK